MCRHFVPTPIRLQNTISISGGVCWTKFETISSKIQMIKNTNADSAGRNNLSGGKDSPCLGCFPARIPPQTPPARGEHSRGFANPYPQKVVSQNRVLFQISTSGFSAKKVRILYNRHRNFSKKVSEPEICSARSADRNVF